MNALEKALADAPWNSDLLSAAMAKRYPGVRHAYTAEQMRGLIAAGYRLRAVTRNPFYPDEVKPALYLSPATDAERTERGIGGKLAEMVRGDDLRRTGLRR
jgi:hypothetical protein